MSEKRILIFSCIALIVGIVIGAAAVEYGRQSYKAEPVRVVFAESDSNPETR